MSLVSEIVSCRSMDFENQRRVFVRRDQGWKWHEIQNVVRTLQNEKPSETQCRALFCRRGTLLSVLNLFVLDQWEKKTGVCVCHVRQGKSH